MKVARHDPVQSFGSRSRPEQNATNRRAFVIAPLAPTRCGSGCRYRGRSLVRCSSNRVRGPRSRCLLGVIATRRPPGAPRFLAWPCWRRSLRSAPAGIMFAGQTWLPNDLAWSITETPRPAWVRGVVSDARGLRHQRAGFGFGGGNDDKVTTRFVLDLTAISDGQNWHDATGRAAVVVTGDRSDIRAGQAVEAAGQIARIGPPLNPGEFDYRAFLQAQGIQAASHASTIRRASGRPQTEQTGRSRSGSIATDTNFKRGCSSSSIRRPLRWPRRCSWAGAKRSTPRSTMRSPGRARHTCSPSLACSCKRLRSRFCSYFAFSAYPGGHLI